MFDVQSEEQSYTLIPQTTNLFVIDYHQWCLAHVTEEV